jgi:hypothetical protein
MSDSELFYRDEWRKYLVDLAKGQEKEIVKKLEAIIKNNDYAMSEKIIYALGDTIGGKFLTAIYNGKLD